MPLVWPSAAKAALAYLYRPLQDLDIYVEDAQEGVFYAELFKRIAPRNIRVARVLPAGNRAAVISKAKSHDFAKRRALFVIDGDLEWVRGDQAPVPHLVYRLDAYCIENLLVHESAAVQIVVEEAVMSEGDAKAKLDFQGWVTSVSQSLVDLFIAFAVLNAANPAEPTVSLGIGKILTASQKGTCARLDPVKVEGLIAEIKQKTIQAVGAQRADQLHVAIRSRVQALSSPTDAVSGKDFLLPLFEFHLWGCTGTKTRRSSLRLRLARYCALERFAGLSKAMTESLRGWREPLRTN